MRCRAPCWSWAHRAAARRGCAKKCWRASTKTHEHLHDPSHQHWLTQAALPFATITGWLRCADSLLSDEPLPRPLWQAAIDQHYPAEEAERYRQTLQSLLRITPSRLPFGQRAETLPGSNAIGEAVRASSPL